MRSMRMVFVLLLTLTVGSLVGPGHPVVAAFGECSDPTTFFPGANLSGVDLAGADLSYCDLSGADLSGADLFEVNLINGNLSGADLSGANLTRADLHLAVLTGANLTGANLTDALLVDANLFGVRRLDTTIGKAVWSRIICPTGNVLPEGFVYAMASDVCQGPTLLMSQLRATVVGYNLQQGLSNSLDTKLGLVEQALVAANTGNRADAANKLQAFNNEVEAQRGEKLTDAQANELVAQVTVILSLL